MVCVRRNTTLQKAKFVQFASSLLGIARRCNNPLNIAMADAGDILVASDLTLEEFQGERIHRSVEQLPLAGYAVCRAEAGHPSPATFGPAKRPSTTDDLEKAAVQYMLSLFPDRAISRRFPLLRAASHSVSVENLKEYLADNGLTGLTHEVASCDVAEEGQLRVLRTCEVMQCVLQDVGPLLWHDTLFVAYILDQRMFRLALNARRPNRSKSVLHLFTGRRRNFSTTKIGLRIWLSIALTTSFVCQ